MKVKKIIVAFALPLFLSSLLFSQSLTELAKKERERRAKLKGKKGIVITNADLTRLKKRPALSISRPAVKSESEGERKSTTEKPLPGKVQPSADTDKEKSTVEITLAELEEKYNKAKEYASLLTTKMNALWQEFYGLDDMADRSKIQTEISETSLKLQKAKEEEAKVKKELDQLRIRIKKKNP